MKTMWISACKAKNNEEYRMILKRRLLLLWIAVAAGLIAAALGLIIFLKELFSVSAYQAGILFGIGIGLFIGSIVGMIQIYMTLSNEKKLKEKRLSETDERELAVNSKALRMTAYIILICLYIMMLFGAIFYPVVMNVSCVLIAIFLISYSLLRVYYRKTM